MNVEVAASKIINVDNIFFNTSNSSSKDIAIIWIIWARELWSHIIISVSIARRVWKTINSHPRGRKYRNRGNVSRVKVLNATCCSRSNTENLFNVSNKWIRRNTYRFPRAKIAAWVMFLNLTLIVRNFSFQWNKVSI